MKPTKETGYYDSGSVYSECWCLNGKVHNTDGPAIIYYNPDGGISIEYWYLNGERLTEEEFELIKKKSKINELMRDMLQGKST